MAAKAFRTCYLSFFKKVEVEFKVYPSNTAATSVSIKADMMWTTKEEKLVSFCRQ